MHVWNKSVAGENEILSFYLWLPSLVHTNWHAGIAVYYILTFIISSIFMLRDSAANRLLSLQIFVRTVQVLRIKIRL